MLTCKCALSSRGPSVCAKSKTQARRVLYSNIYTEVFDSSASRTSDEKMDALLDEAQQVFRRFVSVAVRAAVTVRCVQLDESKGGRSGSAVSHQGAKKRPRPTAKLTSGVVGARGKQTASVVGNGGDSVGAAALVALAEAGEEEADLSQLLLDSEVGNYILTQDEQHKRSAIWEKSFRPFMEERDRRREQRERDSGESSDKYTVNGKLRKKYTKRTVVDATTTTSQAVLATGASVKGSSKKINYDALKVLRNVFCILLSLMIVSFRASLVEMEDLLLRQARLCLLLV